MVQHVSHTIVLLTGLSILLYCLTVLLAESTYSHGLHTWHASQVIDFVQQRQFPPIDVVLLPPFVMDGDKNLTVVSVLRFMPWFRRMHIHDPTHEPSQHAVEYWHTHQHAKVVFFRQPLLDYSTASPFLEERFVVLRPQFVLSNYLFAWHCFVHDSPVWRTCRNGLVPLTRSLLNECTFHHTPADPLEYAMQKAVHDRRIRYVDNHDHFMPPCSAAAVTTVYEAGPRYEPAHIRALLQFEEVHQERLTRPFRIVLAVVAGVSDDLEYRIPDSYAAHVQVWVHLTTLDDPQARLSFICRMIVRRHVFIELDLTQDSSPRVESLGARVMKQLRHLGHQESFQVLTVFSYDTVTGPRRRDLANAVGNKLARAYECPFVPFSSTTPIPDEREWQRLRHL